MIWDSLIMAHLISLALALVVRVFEQHERKKHDNPPGYNQVFVFTLVLLASLACTAAARAYLHGIQGVELTTSMINITLVFTAAWLLARLICRLFPPAQ